MINPTSWQPQEQHILLVSSNPQSLQKNQRLLEDEGVAVTTTNDPNKAIQIFTTSRKKIDAAIFDWSVPGKNNMEILKEMEVHRLFDYIPVLMMIDSLSRSLFLEGKETGIYYFVKKPYDRKNLLGTLQRAIKDHIRYSYYLENSAKLHVHTLLQDGTFHYQTLKEAHQVADWLARVCLKERENIVVGFIEILLNAVEHGNLGIDYHEKTKLLEDEIYIETILNRLELPEYREKRVMVSFEKKGSFLYVKIKDQGNGFDYRKYLTFNEERLLFGHGRGIIMAKELYFDEIYYVEPGNEVHIKVELKPEYCERAFE